MLGTVNRRGFHVRALPARHHTGGVAGVLRLCRAAEFSGALQRGADPADPDRAAGRGQAPVRAGALGLDPAWVKDPRGFGLLINARGESVNDKPAFKNAMKRRRCLIPADGFYEWREDGGNRRPYVVRPKAGGPIAFARIWGCWMGPNGEELGTAA